MKKHVYSLPNILTYLRILAVPLLVACFFLDGSLQTTNIARWLSVGIFIFASITDFFDGYLARVWKQTSNLGKMLDPIADKLLVAAALLILAANNTIAGWSLWAAIIILCREILVSGLREYLGNTQLSIPVSRLAKYKTAFQMVAITFLLAGPAGDSLFNLPLLHGEKIIFTTIGIVLLWVAALLTLLTGWHYLSSGVVCAIEEKKD